MAPMFCRNKWKSLYLQRTTAMCWCVFVATEGCMWPVNAVGNELVEGDKIQTFIQYSR